MLPICTRQQKYDFSMFNDMDRGMVFLEKPILQVKLWELFGELIDMGLLYWAHPMMEQSNCCLHSIIHSSRPPTKRQKTSTTGPTMEDLAGCPAEPLLPLNIENQKVYFEARAQQEEQKQEVY